MSQEDILSLDISVYNLLIVDLLKSETHLAEPIENLRFGEILPQLLLSLDLLVEVAVVGVVHHDAEVLASGEIERMTVTSCRRMIPGSAR